MGTRRDSTPTLGDHAKEATGTMRAVEQHTYGSADVLHLATRSRPAPSERDVLVRVHAAGLDRGAVHLVTGKPYLLRLVFGVRRPRTPVPGRELAGTVVAVGSAVTRFAIGDEVFGIGRGSFAEYAVAPEAKLAHKPATMSFAQAAVVPVSALTALQALTDVGRVKAGQKVLVIGASGGVGTYAVQLAAAFGAEVTGVASAAKLDLVRSLGAAHVLDYSRDDFAATDVRYDLILDVGGFAAISRLRRALAPTGALVLVGGEEGGDWTGGTIGRQLRARTTSLLVRQRLTSCLCKERAGDLERLAALADAGAVRSSVDRTYPLAEVPQAMRYVEAGQARGKIAIIPGTSR